MVSGVVLSAGDSKRMGKTKALLKYKGKTFIENICESLRENKISDRIVVLGDNKDEILSLWKPRGEKIALNKNPEAGQISSLRVGIKSVNSKSKAVLIALVDQPTIPAETYKSIVDFWLKHQDYIIIPKTIRKKSEVRSQETENSATCPAKGGSSASVRQKAENIVKFSQLEHCGVSIANLRKPSPLSTLNSKLYKRGHPIIIPEIYWHLCFDGPDDKGLHWVTHHPAAKVLDFLVNDDNIFKDFDTPDDYKILKT